MKGQFTYLLLVPAMIPFLLSGCRKEPTVSSPKSICTVSTFVRLRYGYADGPLNQAAAKGVSGLIFDKSDNLYFVDSNDNRIRKITPDGMVSTVAGSGEFGFKDGPATVAQFYNPQGFTFDQDGNLYVIQSFAIRKILPSGNVTTFIGANTPGIKSSPVKGDTMNLPRIGDSFLFGVPQAISFDKTGNLFVVEGGNNARIIKISSTKQISNFIGTPFAISDWTLTNTNQVRGPNGIAFDSQGYLYISDNSLGILKLTPQGDLIYFTGDGFRGYVDGPASVSEFRAATSAVFDKAGNLFVGDDKYIRKITPDGTVSTIAGTGDNNHLNTVPLKDGPGLEAQISNPTSLAFDSKGNLYVTDNGGIRKIVFN